VNGAKITRQEFDEALGQQQEQMRQMLGGNFDAAMLDNPEMKRAVVDNLTPSDCCLNVPRPRAWR